MKSFTGSGKVSHPPFLVPPHNVIPHPGFPRDAGSHSPGWKNGERHAACGAGHGAQGAEHGAQGQGQVLQVVQVVQVSYNEDLAESSSLGVDAGKETRKVF